MDEFDASPWSEMRLGQALFGLLGQALGSARLLLTVRPGVGGEEFTRGVVRVDFELESRAPMRVIDLNIDHEQGVVNTRRINLPRELRGHDLDLAVLDLMRRFADSEDYALHAYDLPVTDMDRLVDRGAELVALDAVRIGPRVRLTAVDLEDDGWA